MTVFVGVDSGGTKTTYEAWGDGVDRLLGKDASYHSFSGSFRHTDYAPKLETIARKVTTMLRNYLDLKAIEANEQVVLFVSAAGFAASTRQDIEQRIAAMQIQLPDGLELRALGVCNDAVALLLGHDLDVAVIAGTGSNVLVCNTESDRKEISQLGGHNWLASDPGSGFQIGQRGIRQAMKDFESMASTALLEAFRNCYHVTRGDEQFIQTMEALAVADAEMKGRVAKFAEDVCDLASVDPMARAIVEHEACELAELTAMAFQRYLGSHRSKPLKIAHSGSLFQNECYRTAFEAKVGRSVGGTLQVPKWDHHPSATSAVMKLARTISTEEGRLQLAWPSMTFRPFVKSFL